MKRYHVIPTGLAIVSLLAGLSLAAPTWARPRGHGHGSLEGLEHQIERLNLDRETRTAIYAIIDKARAEQRDMRLQLREAHHALRTLLEQDVPDENAVLAQVDVIGALQTTHRKQALRTFLAVQSHLTPEQRASLRQARHDQEGEPHGRGR